jgi:hypothetical protein
VVPLASPTHSDAVSGCALSGTDIGRARWRSIFAAYLSRLANQPDIRAICATLGQVRARESPTELVTLPTEALALSERLGSRTAFAIRWTGARSLPQRRTARNKPLGWLAPRPLRASRQHPISPAEHAVLERWLGSAPCFPERGRDGAGVEGGAGPLDRAGNAVNTRS